MGFQLTGASGVYTGWLVCAYRMVGATKKYAW
jgi:hypothetical protein